MATQTVYFNNPATIQALEQNVLEKFDFVPVKKNVNDSITIPDNYTYDIVVSYGDPIKPNISDMGNLGTEDWDTFDKRIGDHNDGTHFFPINASGVYDETSDNRGLLAINHENCETMFMHTGGAAKWVNIAPSGIPLEWDNGAGQTGLRYEGKTGWGTVYRTDWREVMKEAFSLGVSVVEIYRESTQQPWKVKLDSPFNKRFHQNSPINYSGIAVGSERLKTKLDPNGTTAQGMKNLCGAGYTPWGTYLTAEENQWQYYAARTTSTGYLQTISTAERLHQRRYMSYGSLIYNTGTFPLIANTDNSVSKYYLCIPEGRNAAGQIIDSTGATIPDYVQTYIDSHDMTANPDQPYGSTGDFRNSLNAGNFIIEIDPFATTSTGSNSVLKRTSLGRAGWENAAICTPIHGKKLAVYLPCDSTSEYIYKYVSNVAWDAADAAVKYSTTPGARMAIGSKYLDSGKYYAARFNGTGAGQWVELTLTGTVPAGYEQAGQTLATVYPIAKYANVSGGAFDDTTAANQALFTDATATGTVFRNEADVRLFARLAASYLGATRMDRPEWVDVDPLTNVVYCALTNNANRFILEQSRYSRPGVDPANPRVTYPPNSWNQDGLFGSTNNTTTAPTSPAQTGENGNRHGHIIRFLDVTNGEYDPESTTFEWDIYAFGCAGERTHRNNISRLSEDNDFSSPDTCYFSQASKALWIQSDDGNYTNTTNNQALICLPGNIGDGFYTEVDNRAYQQNGTITTSKVQGTMIGALPIIRRFMVGPKGCEITGFSETPSGNTTFSCVQHPGENTDPNWGNRTDLLQSTWPLGGANRPRSSVVAFRKRRGDGPIGLTSARTL
jgi:secreted PhoX family phosphatase